MLGLKNRMTKMVHSLSYKAHIARANAWRSAYNPLRGLTIARAVSHLEAGERGAYAELQWLYRYIEKRDAVLGSLVDRRLGAIEKLDWDIKIREEIDPSQQARAEAQRMALKAAYNRIDNFSEALGNLAHASFRGFTHLQKISEDGKLTKLDHVDQWHWVRDGVYGEWQYNANSSFGTTKGEEIDASEFIIRTVERPINEVALICFIRKNLSQKDWDAFVEVYGVPAIFITLPQGVNPKDLEEYQAAVESIIGNMRGTLPGGSDVKTVDNGARGVNPFSEHLKYQDEMLVLRGTGGKLTMLNDATGIGGSQGDVHQDVFDELAAAEGTKIAQLVRCSLDDDLLLQEGFGDEESLVYFDLGVNEETDAGEFLAGAAQLHTMGKSVDNAQIEEKTGYKISDIPQPPQPDPTSPVPPAPLRNRESNPTLEEAAMAAMHAAQVKDNQPLFDRLAEALQKESAEELVAALEEFSADLPEWIGTTAAQEKVWETLFESAFADGEAEPASGEGMRNHIQNNCGTGANGFESGNKCGGSKKGTSREVKTKRRDSSQEARRDEHPHKRIEQRQNTIREVLDSKEGTTQNLQPPLHSEQYRAAGVDASRPVKVSTEQLGHITKSHGNDAAELKRGQRGVTRNDFIKHLPSVIDKPDSVVKSSESGKQGQPRYKVERTLPRGEKHRLVLEDNNSSLRVVTYNIQTKNKKKRR